MNNFTNLQDFSVLIPWRTDNGPRQRNLDFVLDRFECLFGPRAEICLADSGHETFNRSASRNLAFERSSCRNILIADADTPPMPEIDAAFELVDLFHTYAHPYEWYYALVESATLKLLANGAPTQIPRPSAGDYEFRMRSWAGAICMTRDQFEYVGGYDESFMGWGYEDTAFRMAADTLLGQPRRAPGYVVHLWHPPAMEGTWDNFKNEENKCICDRYRNVEGNKEAMYALTHDGARLT